MNKANKVEILSEPLNTFVDKYFVNMEFDDLFSVRDDEVIKVLSEVENTLVKLIQKNYDDEDPSLWYNREMCMRTLVILTHMDYFAEIMERNNFLDRGLMLYTKILDSFSKKILEDPEIVKAIEENRLEEEIEKRFAKDEAENKRSSNFLTDIDEPTDLSAIPVDYEPVPDKI